MQQLETRELGRRSGDGELIAVPALLAAPTNFATEHSGRRAALIEVRCLFLPPKTLSKVALRLISLPLPSPCAVLCPL
jgi:hypothetical protein